MAKRLSGHGAGFGWLLVLTGQTILAGAGRAHAMGYIVTRIADTSGEIQSFLEIGGVAGVSINESGTVAFYARLNGGGAGIFTGSGGPITTIADTNREFMRFTRDGFMIGFVDQTIPAISDTGQVAFYAGLREAKALAAAWRRDYNHRRPHSSLGYQPPAAYAARCRQAELGAPPPNPRLLSPPRCAVKRMRRDVELAQTLIATGT